MSRPISVRKNYTADAIVLRRLTEAIQIDPRRSDAWKSVTLAVLESAISQLLEPLTLLERTSADTTAR
jgi:hypothetical protein